MNTKGLHRTGWVILVLCILVLISFFIFRDLIFERVIQKAETRIREDYGLNMNVVSSGFSGFSSVYLSGLTIVPESGDTLLHLDSLNAGVSVLNLIIGTLKLQSVFCTGATLKISCIDSVCNYSWLLRKDRNSNKNVKPESSVNSREKNYSGFVDHLLRQTFNLAPQQALLENLRLIVWKDTVRETLIIPRFESRLDSLSGELVDEKSDLRWKCQGVFSQRHETFDVLIYPMSPSRQALPLLGNILNAICSFDTLHLALDSRKFSHGLLNVKGHFSLDGFSLLQKKISDDVVKIDHLTFDYSVTVGQSSISLDSSSLTVLNRIRIHPFIRISEDTSSAYTLRFHTDTMPANDFFVSLPAGMFDEVRDIRADGSLQYRLSLYLDAAYPDSVRFNSSMQKIKFRLRDSGKININKLNGEFLQPIYENNVYIRSFEVGPENPSFTPIDQISPFFKNAVLTSEDGSFYYHQGFNEEAFAHSIATNFKAGKFIRGGSTISMQLVKNVFLSRRKTIARKAEEAIIVWLIESGRMCSKERMLEVYFNIIELGPNIYGIGEASEFYFSKKPSGLTLSESIFLSSLLPKPKWFRSSFDSTGHLKPYLADYYRLVAGFMLRKNLITQDDYDNLVPDVDLKGVARDMVIKPDSSAAKKDILYEDLPGTDEE